MAEAIASTSAGTLSAKSFVEAFRTNTSFDYDQGQGTVQQFEDALVNNRDDGRQFLYMAFGRQSSPWSPDDNVPPTPLDIDGEYNAFYDDIVGLKQVTNTDIQVVTERINFIIGESYSIGDVVLVNDTSNSRYRVYRLRTVAGGGSAVIATIDPNTVVEDSDNIATTADGTWEFLYNMTLDEKFRFTTGSDTDRDSNGWMLARDSIYRSQGRAAIIYIRLGDEANAALAAGFRQIGIIRNQMTDEVGGTGNLVKLATNQQPFYLPADIIDRTVTSQRFIDDSIIYLENRTLITKTPDSFEDIRIVLRF